LEEILQVTPAGKSSPPSPFRQAHRPSHLNLWHFARDAGCFDHLIGHQPLSRSDVLDDDDDDNNDDDDYAGDWKVLIVSFGDD